MKYSTEVFDLQSSIIRDYATFINSFITIADEEIRDAVKKELGEGRFWPEPLIQFNPSFQICGPVGTFCGPGKLLHADIARITGKIDLFKHQTDALKLGIADEKDFVVTSGTGSGKSLTYLVTIFNHLLHQKQKKGIKALIVYPMNALINSQKDSLDTYRDNYQQITGQPLPITYAQYTGQEKEGEKLDVQEQLPDIILTNYMMLELLLTRSHESIIRNSIFESLRYLVFDELHTYRGRQGADVSMLIRKIKTQASQTVLCIGTSATMVSGGTLDEQRKTVADVSSKIFGIAIRPEQIVMESLVRCFEEPSDSGVAQTLLAKALHTAINKAAPEHALKSHILAVWLENCVALEVRENILVRRKPISLSEIVEKLAQDSGVDSTVCRTKIVELLEWIAHVNSQKRNLKYSYLPFRLHQFISQTGIVYISLGSYEGRRFVSLDPALCKQQGETCVPVFPTVFSRFSGQPFVSVVKNEKKKKFGARDFQEVFEENADDLTEGYLILDHNGWNPEEDFDYLPDSWGRFDKKGAFRINKDVLPRLPQKVYYDKDGNFSYTDEYEQWGWFMPSPLLFDPTAGIFFHGGTSESTKLSRLGSEGRSTSTTVLSFTILKHLMNYGFEHQDQKLLSFTDNRQDAALQSGHFNDFMRTIRIRAAIYKAVCQHGDVDYSRLDQAMIDALNLDQKEYAKDPSNFPSSQRENENALKYYLIYRALYDLRHGWKVILPNLEQCALLAIDYKDLLENCSVEEEWKNIPVMCEWSPEKRAEMVFQILEYFRKGYAIYSNEFLTSRAISEKIKIVRERLKEFWSFDGKERIEEPSFFRIEKLPDVKTRLFTQSVGSRTPLGKFIKKQVQPAPDRKMSDVEYLDFMKKLLALMVDAGWLHHQDYPERNDQKIGLFQLKVDKILWRKGDLQKVYTDKIRIRSYKDVVLQPNRFFQDVYQTDFGAYSKTFYGLEHTGQLTTEDRQDREGKFKSGECSVLFCSPTMELGVDIRTLNVVHMRNVPPNPANYAQRSGRAGRSGQAALVFVNCSTFSPHDRHYFKNKQDMVAGTVAPPKIDLYNPELLEAHLHSLYMAKVDLKALKDSVVNVIEIDSPDLPLNHDIIETFSLTPRQRLEIKATFSHIIETIDVLGEARPTWLNDEWVDNSLSNTLAKFDRALDRWRSLYKAATMQLENAQTLIKDGRYKEGSLEKKDAYRSEKLADRQRSLLKNDLGKSKNHSVSEFYPFRYLAAEGFLPGYNFTRLPIRSFIPIGEAGGEYISRPRFIALKEFGPRNRIYHNGYRYRVDQILVQEAEKSLTKAKISTNCGYIFMENEGNYDFEVCPFSNVSLSEGTNREIITDLLEMSQTRCQDESRITCEEEERLRQGYTIETYFSAVDLSRVETAVLKNDDEEFLKVRLIPAARIVQINKRWKIAESDGFLLGLTSGRWKKPLNQKKNPPPEEEIVTGEENRTVKLYTWDTADVLYLIPIKALALEPDGVITLQYALKRAIENIFQVESNEISVVLMGNPKEPNIMVYESAQGSLGVLSQFMNDVGVFRRVIEEAKRICRFDEPQYIEPASYDDLLSYYNQTDHQKINRFTIKDALDKLLACSLELHGGGQQVDYEEHYQSLKRQCDPNSSTEHTFLDYLHANGLRLPDAAQKKVEYVFAQADFFYEPNIWVFCDGTPHDKPAVQENDRKIRDAIGGHGDQVIVYYYKNDLLEFTTRRSDIFKKVK
ncbi:MAG: DEAD/DEAH box helicase [Chitinivibrionales bacterium]|nr:DEAD/DEAH box helicase [Chitinivibrionales bacterium]